MNNKLVLRMSQKFAQRVQMDVGDEVERQVERAWQLALARSPTPEEQQLSMQLVTQQGLRALCRGLFNLHEFVVIE